MAGLGRDPGVGPVARNGLEQPLLRLRDRLPEVVCRRKGHQRLFHFPLQMSKDSVSALNQGSRQRREMERGASVKWQAHLATTQAAADMGRTSVSDASVPVEIELGEAADIS